jgi:predicted nuclease of predicted toxin-antitoxin system
VTIARPILRIFTDEGVPDSVGDCFDSHGHTVIRLRESVATGSPDPLVCAAAEANEAILVALDGDMRAIAQRRGLGQRRFRKLSLIKVSCKATRAAERVNAAMSLIEHEWLYSADQADRRLFMEIGSDVIRTFR